MLSSNVEFIAWKSPLFFYPWFSRRFWEVSDWQDVPWVLATYTMYRFLLLFAPLLTQTFAHRPNIVFILSDDMGYGDLKAFNPESKISTPHLDKLAAGGMVFTDAHSGGSTCIPSRYSLMTGRFSARKDRFAPNSGPVIQEGRETLASLLRKGGYKTAMVGKWHLGFDKGNVDKKEGKLFNYSEPFTGGPVDRGFDSFFGMHASLDIPPYFYIRDRKPTMLPTGKTEAHDNVGGPEGWNNIQGAFWRAGDIAPDFKFAEVTPRFADEACDIISGHDGHKPLFLYLAMPSPHTPWMPTEEFHGKSGAGMYGDFTMQVDSVVGQVVASLDKAGMTDNTLLVFSSDNGPVWYEKDVGRFGHKSVGSLRGCKASVWEGGHRVPFIVKWPGKVRPGTRTDATIAFADVFATLAGAANLGGIPAGKAEDSVSFLPTLLNPCDPKPRPPLLHDKKVIREGYWKLIDTKGSRGFNAPKGVKYGVELYNLRDDLSEQHDLAKEMPGKVEELRGKLGAILGG
jgi:arylsulfatase A